VQTATNVIDRQFGCFDANTADSLVADISVCGVAGVDIGLHDGRDAELLSCPSLDHMHFDIPMQLVKTIQVAIHSALGHVKLRQCSGLCQMYATRTFTLCSARLTRIWKSGGASAMWWMA
jgi:hypothetical protein